MITHDRTRLTVCSNAVPHTSGRIVIGIEHTQCQWVQRGGRAALDVEGLREQFDVHPLVGEILARRGFSDLDKRRLDATKDL